MRGEPIRILLAEDVPSTRRASSAGATVDVELAPEPRFDGPR
jgi:hypothetical protein